jgi:hypothetical protein
MRQWLKKKLRKWLEIDEIAMRVEQMHKSFDLEILRQHNRICDVQSQVSNLSTLAADVPVYDDNGFIVIVSPLNKGRVEFIPLNSKIKYHETYQMIARIKDQYGSRVVLDLPQGMHQHFEF